MDSAHPANSPPPAESRAGGGSPSLPLKAQDDSVDADCARVRRLLPREVREREGRGPVEHRAVEVVPRPVAWTIERLGVRVEGDRAAQVRAVDREHVDLALVLDDEAAESQLAGAVVAAAVGHDERRVGAGRGVELDRVSVSELVQRLADRDRQGRLLLPLGAVSYTPLTLPT